MIDNIVLLITGTLHQRAIGDLLPRCHPLGSFEQLGAITVADTPAQLYSAVLVDTPLGTSVDCPLRIPSTSLLASYFIDCISEHDLDELNVEIIRSTLYKVNDARCAVRPVTLDVCSGLFGRLLQLLPEAGWHHGGSDVRDSSCMTIDHR